MTKTSTKVPITSVTMFQPVVADGRAGGEHGELGARVLLRVEVLLEGEPGEHRTDEGTDELAEEVEDAT